MAQVQPEVPLLPLPVLLLAPIRRAVERDSGATIFGYHVHDPERFGVIEFDTEGNILNANQNFLDITGYYKDELVGENHRIFVNKDDRAGDEYKRFWKDLSAGNMREGEFSRVGKGGKNIELVENYAPIKGRDGSISKVMMVALDITKFKSVEEKS